MICPLEGAMEAESSPAAERPKPKLRWHRLTPDRLVLGLLTMEGLLLLSEWFPWFAFSRYEGAKALIALVAAGLTLSVMLLWFIAAVIFRRHFQYSLRSLLLLVAAVAIPCSWLAVVIEKQDKEAVTSYALMKKGAGVGSETTWLGRLLRDNSLQTVTRVQLSMRPVTDADMARLPTFRQLQELQLDGTQITDAGFVHLQGLRQLQELVLAGTQITDAALVHLQELRQLRHIDLSRTKVTDAGLVYLQQFSQLQDLGLDNTQVTDAGLVYLQGLKQLKSLNLWNTRITDAGVVHLRGLSQLQMLHLCGTKISDAGLVHLQGLKQLKYLNIWETKVTCQGVKKIRQALPKCDIEP
jgi:Leucine-rich repeat (LRR) protein